MRQKAREGNPGYLLVRHEVEDIQRKSVQRGEHLAALLAGDIPGACNSLYPCILLALIHRFDD